MRNDILYANTMVRKKRGKMTSLPVTWLPVMSYPLTMLLPVIRNGTFRTTTMVRKKARECTSGHVQNITPAMTSLPVTWLHVTSFPVRATSGDITSSNACAMTRSHLLPPKYALTCPAILLWFLDLEDPINNPWKHIKKRNSSFPLRIKVKGIAKAFNWLKCLGGFLHIRLTAGCQISTLIFEFCFVEGGLYKYSMNNISRTAKFLRTWSFNQRYCPGL
jgi:hypothetical protein